MRLRNYRPRPARTVSSGRDDENHDGYLMKVTYDPNRDELRILFSNAPIASSRAEVPGLILDLDSSGRVVSLEVARASEQMYNPRVVEFSEYSTVPEPGNAMPPFLPEETGQETPL